MVSVTISLFCVLMVAGVDARATVAAQWQTYYTNYFNSEGTCTYRGGRMTTPGNPDYVPGMDGYRCYRNGGQTKWSMDVLWL